MKTLFATVVGLMTALANPGMSQAPPAPPPSETVVVPFTLLPSGHFLVEVKMNDKGPYYLVFDTGAPLMLLNSRISKDAGVAKKKTGGFSLFSGPSQVDVKTLEVGSAKADHVPGVVMDHPTVEAISKAFEKDFGKIEGIVGFPFFARYKMTVDYKTKQLTFTPNGYKPGDYLTDMMGSVMKMSNAKPEPKVQSAGGLWGIEVEKDAKDSDPGVVVKLAYEGGAAAEAGLKPGDRVLTIDGRWTDTPAETSAAAAKAKPGTPCKVLIQRGGLEFTLMVTPRKGI
jgi:hypothetical protein